MAQCSIGTMQEQWHTIDKYAAPLRSFISARSSNKSDVDDIAQETFLRYYTFSQRQEVIYPLGCLYRIARNLMIDRSRRHSPLNHAIGFDDVDEICFSTLPRQEEGRLLADLQAAYAAALQELPPRCAQVFHLRRHREMPAPDVADQLSITTRMVQKHMVTAISHLRERLSPFLFDTAVDCSPLHH